MEILRALGLALSLVLAAPLTVPTAAGPAPEPAPAVADACATCGKRIWFGERCLTCVVDAERTARERPCADCEEPILVGERCAGCALARRKAQLTEALEHPCADCEEPILLGSRCRSCAAADLERRLGALVVAGRTGAATAAAMAPAVRERLAAALGLGQDDEASAAAAEAERGALARSVATAEAWLEADGAALRDDLVDLGEDGLAAVGRALEVASGLHRAKRELAKRGFDGLGRIPVESELGRTSLEDLARTRLLEAAPGLAGSELTEDPAAVLAAMLALDHLYVLTELQLVEGPEGEAPRTLLEALEATSGTDPTATLAVVTILESVRKLREGEDLTRALHDIERSLLLLNPTAAEEVAQERARTGAGADSAETDAGDPDATGGD